MPSISIPLPKVDVVQHFCTQHEIRPIALFELAWALVQHCYFDTDIFLLEQEDEELQNTHHKHIVNFLPELVSKSELSNTLKHAGLQQQTPDAVLFLSSAEEFDSSLQKIWTKVRFSSSGSDQVENGHVASPEVSDFDIQVLVQSYNTSFNATLHYDGSLAETRDLNDIARAFGHIIEKMIHSKSHETVADINLLNEYDLKRIIDSNVVTPTVVEDCLHGLIGKSISKNPDSGALLSWDGSLTYSELDKLSSKLASHLVKTFAIGPERVVPLCFEKSIWAVVAMLAVLKSGAAYCCLDPAHPQARRNYMIDLVDAPVVLCSPIHQGIIQNCHALVIDEKLVTNLDIPKAYVRSNVDPSNACVIAFTSGTTGNPKAIIHSHTSICSGLLANAPVQNINRSSIRLFQWAAYTFDVSITETFSPLIYGGLVCIPSEEERLNNVEECMIRMQVDWAYFTPTFARFFRRYTIPSLTQLILGGEAVTVDDVRDWVGKVRVLNAYGPAESITWFLEPQLGLSSTISIGRPINMRAWITNPDDHGRLMPIGAIGELLIEGPSLFRCYLKNKEKTEQSLIEPPPWRIQSNLEQPLHMYKTGDLVRYLPDGTMTYVGRKDTMIKLYGQRMELEEVETMLRRNLPEHVLSSADIVRPVGENEEPVLVAFLSITEDYSGPSMQELKTLLQNKLMEALPAFMVPRIYIPVESMPYNSSRKLDRARLRQGVSNLTRSQLVELLQSKDASQKGKSHIMTEMENTIHKLWVDTLMLDPEQIGPDDNFFSLGGSSITALHVTAAAKSEGIRLSYPDLFRAPTLRSLALTVSRSSDLTPVTIDRLGLIDEALRSPVVSDAISQCGVPESLIEDIYPLAPQQQGLWALSLIREGDYRAQFILTLNPDVDVQTFCTAWETVVNALPTLRTRFIESASGSYQVVTTGKIHWHTSSDLDEYLKEDIKTDLAFGSPLVRQALISEKDTNATRHKIVWTIHHALYDGESVPLFLNTVARAYEGVSPNPLSGPFNHFINYVHSLDDKEARKYWRSQFDELTSTAYPALPSPNYRPNPTSVHRNQIDFKRQAGSRITTATILRTALGLTVAKLAKSWDAIVGVTLAGRTAPVSNIEIVIGPTFVTLPTRLSHRVDTDVKSYLEETQASIVEMIPFEHTGMQKIATFSPECDDACRFQTICLVQTPDDKSYTKVFGYDDTTGGFGRFNTHALMVLFFTNESGVEAVASYDPSVISDEQIIELNHDIETVLHILCLEEASRPVLSVLPFQIDTPHLLNGSKLSTTQNPTATLRDASNSAHEELHNGTYFENLTEMESFVASAWSEVLRVREDARITASSDYFRDFGGNSLLSLRLTQFCRDKGVRLNVKDIFQNPKLADMARAASQIASKEQETSSIASSLTNGNSSGNAKLQELSYSVVSRAEAALACNVPVEQVQDLYAATPLQEGLLALSATQPGSYVSQTVYTLASNVDLNKFRESWDQVYSEEEILRTRLIQPSTIPGAYQVVLDNKIDWKFVSHLAAYVRDSENVNLGFGSALSRFAIVQEETSPATYFVLTVHHALYDGWSMPLLLERVFETYFTPTRKHIRTPFKMFVKAIASSKPADTTEYWKSQFLDSDFTQFPRPLLGNESRGRQINLERSISLPQSRQNGILTSTILRAAWGLLLSTYVKAQDVVFGATLSGRNVPLSGIEKVIGPTLTTVPIRIKFDKSEPLNGFLQRIQEQSVKMMDYEHTGLQSISKISPEACNFQNLLVLQPRGITTDQSSLWHPETSDDSSNFFSYPLVLQCIFEDNDENMSIIATFDESRISKTQMNRIVNQYQNIVAQLCRSDVTELDQLDMLCPEDSTDLRKWIHDTPAPETVDRYLHDQILEQVKRHPSSVALSSSWRGELTYEELYELSNKLASHLHKLGAKPGVMIPVMFDKSIYTVVAMLSVLISGAAFVPVDPEAPESRRELLFDQVDASIILTSPEYAHVIRRKFVLGVDLEFLQDLAKPAAESQLVDPQSMNFQAVDPAYVLFTSGSTGIPKGVVISHRAVSSSVLAHGNSMGFSDNTRALQFCSYTFDVSIAEIFTTLVYGGTVCVPSSGGRLNDLSNEISTMKVNWSFLTPSVAKLLDPSEVPTLKTLVLGGEEVCSNDVSRWSNSGLRIINGYGPTEACVFCVTRDIVSPATAGTIGLPIGCKSFIVDPEDHDKLAPIGTVGEMLVAGPILAKEYLNDAARSKAVFIKSPAWASSILGLPSTQTFYKTGDIVRYNEFGEIEYMSRKDLQVKVRGLRLEIEDIEHWILKDGEVKHALVVPLKSEQGGSRTQLVSIVSLLTSHKEKHAKPLTLISAEVSRPHLLRIRENIERHLPLYAVPSAWICVNELPLSTSSKISRKAVAEWLNSLTKDEFNQAISATGEDPAGGQRPTTELEGKIRDIWSSVLELSARDIVINKSFLRYGGDSISAIRVVKECRKASINVTVKDLLLATGISDLARIAEHNPQESLTSTVPSNKQVVVTNSEASKQRIAAVSGVQEASIEHVTECTPTQEHMLSKSDAGFYNLEMIFEIQSGTNIDILRLRNAWYQVMKRHSILRTVISRSERSGKHDQIILKDAESTLVEVDSAEEQVDLQFRSQISHSRAYEKDKPHHRLTVQRSSKGKTFLKLEISHAITDAVSLGIVFRDLELAYDDQFGSQEAPQFSQYQLRLKEQAESDRTYWKQYCADASPCILPTSIQTTVADNKLLYATVEQPNSVSVAQFCQQNGISVANLFHAIWALVLKLHASRPEEVVFGYVVSGRDLEIDGIDNIVGPLISTLVARYKLGDTTTLEALLGEVRDHSARSSGKNYCDVAQIESQLGVKEKLFNTVVNFRKYPRPSSDEKSSIKFEYLDGFDPWAYDIVLTIDEVDDNWKIALAYLSDSIGIRQAEEIASDFSSLLNFVLANSQKSVSSALADLKRRI